MTIRLTLRLNAEGGWSQALPTGEDEYVCLCALKGGQRLNRKGWQEIIKRLIESQCLESRIKNNSAKILRMKPLEVRLQCCKWKCWAVLRKNAAILQAELLTDEKTAVRPRKKQSGQPEKKTFKSPYFSAINKNLHQLAQNSFVHSTLTVIYKHLHVFYP